MTSPTLHRVHTVDTAAAATVQLGAGGPVRIGVARPAATRAAAVAGQLGFDTAALTRDAAAHRATIRATADGAVRGAVAASAAGASTLSAELAAHSAGLQVLADGGSDSFSSISVPGRIFTTGDLQLDATNVAAFNSTAKVVRPLSEGITAQSVVFSFPYDNTSGVDQVITVTGVIGLNGVVEATDDGGWTVFGHDHNILDVFGTLKVFADTDGPTDVGLLTDSYQFLHIDAYEDSFPISVGAIEVDSIARGTALGAADLLVKAGRRRVFQLAAQFNSNAPGGGTSLDFTNGAFAVSGFGIFVHVTS